MTIQTNSSTQEITVLNSGFERIFLFGSCAVGLVLFALLNLQALPLVVAIFFYTWFVAQPHFVSTYTRVRFTGQYLRQNIFLIGILPVLVFCTLLALYKIFGLWIYMSLYMYVQWFHFTRQSYGVSRFYRRRSGGTLADDTLTDLVIYAMPIWGILRWSMRKPDFYLGLPVKVFPVSVSLDPWIGTIVFGLTVAWMAGRFVQWRRGTMPVLHTVYVATHLVMFAVCYVWTPVLEYGWAAIGIWHSIQYLMFVWLFTNQKQKAPGGSKTFFEKLSTVKYLPVYILLVFGFSVCLFAGWKHIGNLLQANLIVPLLLFMGTIIFHHYIVDAIIWRRPKQAAKA